VIRIILFFSVFINILYADRLYYIQFGSFRQLAVLESSIKKLPPNMRSHVVVVNSNGWFIPFAYHTRKLQALKSKLPSYKRYFPDAHIASSPYILNHKVVRNYTKKRYKKREEYVVKYVPPPTPTPIPITPTYQNVAISEYESSISYTPQVTTIVSPPLPTPIIIKESIIPTPRVKVYNTKIDYTKFNKRMLSGKHYYLAYKSLKKNTPDLLVKVSFKNHRVSYLPIIGDMSMKEAKYLVDNNRLYMFADSFSKDGAFSQIEGNQKDYILVSSWFNGKKINTLRYYYDINEAKQYLGKESSSKLATALEDGEFDRVEQAFIGVDGVYAIDDEDW
jgi:hypothetical protein